MLEVALFVLAVDFVVELDDVVALLLPLPRVLHRRRIGLLVVVVPPLELAAVFVLVERLVVAQLLRFVLRIPSLVSSTVPPSLSTGVRGATEAEGGSIEHALQSETWYTGVRASAISRPTTGLSLRQIDL